jgi:phenylpropionate dioxygenase-like ring-hydroxylating dioxygenase large terminal subunit
VIHGADQGGDARMDSARSSAAVRHSIAIDPGALVDERRVHRDVYTDSLVFDAEMQRIFRRTWIYVGHESEVLNPGDYKTTTVGREPVILVRDDSQALRVLVNRCTHRGATVCQPSAGRTSAFRCSYHGWTFGLAGNPLGVAFADGYVDAKDAVRSLAQAPRVESYRGFVFASFNPDVPVLTDHLRPVLPYIDLFVEASAGFDIAVAKDAYDVIYDGNWKMQLENGVDGYHLNFTHQSTFPVVQQRTGSNSRYLTNSSQTQGTVQAFSSGQSIMDMRTIAVGILRKRLDILPNAPPAGADLDAFYGIQRGEDAYLSTAGSGVAVNIFPNLQLGSSNICEIHPIAVDRTRVILRPVLLSGAPDAVNRVRLRYHEFGSGPAGFVQPDDLEMFERAQTGMAAEAVEWLDLSRGSTRESVGPEDQRIGQITDEAPLRALYRWWRELMETTV